MRQVSDKRRRRDAVYASRREQVWVRSSGRCEHPVTPQCTGQCEQVHHVAGRGGVDPHRLANLIGLCAACHGWVHANPAAARDVGLMVSRHT